VVCADFSVADGERSRNGDDDRMAVVALECDSGNRKNEISGAAAFRHK